MNLQARYMVGTCIYGFMRTIIYAPPVKKDEYMIDRAVKVFIWTGASPILAPAMVFQDLHNLEHKLRKMPGPMNRFPWQD
jgi:hypothetical protein